MRAVGAAVAVGVTTYGTGSTAALAAGAVVVALAACTLLRPDLPGRRAFDLALASTVVGYGLVLPAEGGALLVLFGAAAVGDHLGVVPWSDRLGNASRE